MLNAQKPIVKESDFFEKVVKQKKIMDANATQQTLDRIKCEKGEKKVIVDVLEDFKQEEP